MPYFVNRRQWFRLFACSAYVALSGGWANVSISILSGMEKAPPARLSTMKNKVMSLSDKRSRNLMFVPVDASVGWRKSSGTNPASNKRVRHALATTSLTRSRNSWRRAATWCNVWFWLSVNYIKTNKINLYKLKRLILTSFNV